MALKGTTNSVTISPAAATAAYPLTLPAAQGAASTYLQNSGTGVLTWVTNTGYVTGPASATDTALALYSGTTGKIIQNSTVTVSSLGAVAGVASLALKGTTNSVTISPAAATAAYPLTLPAAQGAASTFLQNNGTGTLTWVTAGNVAGPATATDTALALYSGTTGKIIQNSTVTVSSLGAVAGVASLALKGTTNSVTISPAAATAAYPLTLPAAQGAASTFLRNDGTGTLTWVGAFYFRSYNTSASCTSTIQTFVTTGISTWLVVQANALRLAISDNVQQQGGFTNSTNNVTIPTAGSYQIIVYLNLIMPALVNTTWGQLVKTVGVNPPSVLVASGATGLDVSVNVTLMYVGSFLAGDIVDVRINSNQTGSALIRAYTLSIVQL